MSPFLLIFLAIQSPTESPAEAQMESVCIGKMEDSPEKWDKEAEGKWGRKPSKYQFTIQFDKLEPVAMSRERAIVGPPLNRHTSHKVSIFDAGKRIESFSFRFPKAEKSEPLCLSYIGFYQTWLLEPPNRRSWCNCPQ